MKTRPALAATGVIAACRALLPRGAPASGARRPAWDAVLGAASAGLVALFLLQDGFIGNGGIPPHAC